LRDKPGKNRDHYHSCCLSGLLVSQHNALTSSDSGPLPQHMLGPYSNLLEPIHTLYNVVLDKCHEGTDDGDYKIVVVHSGGWQRLVVDWWCFVVPGIFVRRGREKSLSVCLTLTRCHLLVTPSLLGGRRGNPLSTVRGEAPLRAR
jgi:hypothetical protein